MLTQVDEVCYTPAKYEGNLTQALACVDQTTALMNECMATLPMSDECNAAFAKFPQPATLKKTMLTQVDEVCFTPEKYEGNLTQALACVDQTTALMNECMATLPMSDECNAAFAKFPQPATLKKTMLV